MKKVTAAILVNENKILIAQRNSFDKLAGKWEFPGGKIEDDETPQECLAREMREEFQIVINVRDFFMESIYHYEQGVIQLLAYWCEWVSGELNAQVHDDFKWVTVEELKLFDFASADIPFVEQLTQA